VGLMFVLSDNKFHPGDSHVHCPRCAFLPPVADKQRKRTFTRGLEWSIINQQLSSLQPRLTDRVLSMNEHQSCRSDCKRRNLLCLEFCGDVLLNPYLICVPARGQPGDEDGRTSSRYFVGS